MIMMLLRRWRPTWSRARCTNISFVTYRLNPEFQFPQALAPWVPHYLELGPLYKLYMVALTVFATNAINILAGVNGLEVHLLQPLLLPCSSTLMQMHGHADVWAQHDMCAQLTHWTTRQETCTYWQTFAV